MCHRSIYEHFLFPCTFFAPINNFCSLAHVLINLEKNLLTIPRQPQRFFYLVPLSRARGQKTLKIVLLVILQNYIQKKRYINTFNFQSKCFFFKSDNEQLTYRREPYLSVTIRHESSTYRVRLKRFVCS